MKYKIQRDIDKIIERIEQGLRDETIICKSVNSFERKKWLVFSWKILINNPQLDINISFLCDFRLHNIVRRVEAVLVNTDDPRVVFDQKSKLIREETIRLLPGYIKLWIKEFKVTSDKLKELPED